ncbi:hypothetical protein QUF50_04425 [Thiotrichales bacterium HSG1]|nr:hypothetical protein [Thiotrichales bacterium HSG1]
MGTEDSTTETTNNSSSIIAGVSSLIVLIVIIVMVTSLLNNKNISVLETRIEQLETRLQSESKPVIDSNTIVMTASKQNIPLGTTDNRNTKVHELENQLKTFAKQFKNLTSKVNSFDKKLNQQTTSLQTALKNKTKSLTKSQTDEVKGLQVQLQSINRNIANLQRERKQLSIRMSKNTDISGQINDHASKLKMLTAKLQNMAEQAINPNQNEQQISDLKLALEAEVAKHYQQQDDKLKSLEAQFQMLIAGIAGSTEE